jgi:putative Mg2+ transporter-C (MgtC) family protein
VGPDLSLDQVARLLLASLVGGVIGLERELHGRPAGFRTHLLVALGSCLFVISSLEFHRIYGVDPGRMAAQVVTGIGFLGAGAIMREKAYIRGLTTAACLWLAAALGVACGIGLFYLAVCVTALALFSLLLLKQLENRLPKDTYLQLRIWGDDSLGLLSRVDEALASLGVAPTDSKIEKNLALRRLFIEFQVRCTGKGNPAQLVEHLSKVAGVRRVRVE